MKRLTLVRHAKSSWSDSGLQDHDRPLNSRGQRDAPQMGQRIQEAGIRPSLIVSSTAVRAWTTAKFIATELTYPAEFLQRDKDLYNASLDALLAFVSEQEAGFNNIMVVAHNPGMTQFANYLVPGLTDNLPTCGVVSVTIDSDDWDLRDTGSIKLDLYDYPKNR